MSDKRKYPKVRRANNWDGDKFPLFQEVVVQEKLDGSNVTIEFTRNEKQEIEMNLFSRTAKIKDNENGRKNWGTLIDWAQKHFDIGEIRNIMNDDELNVLRLHGEWLMMAKLPYNKTHKNSFWLFDVVSQVRGYEESIFAPAQNIKELAKEFNVHHVPIIATGVTLNDVILNVDDYTENKKTAMQDSDSPREGVVVKLLDGSMRMKFVSSKFKEGMGLPRTKDVPLFQINAQLVTDNMIQKYIHKLKEEGIIEHYVDYNDGKTIGTLFKNSGKLVEDFMEEEFANFLKLVTKAVKKEAGKNLKNYIGNQAKLQKEVKIAEQRDEELSKFLEEKLSKVLEEDDSEMVEL